MIYRVNGSKSVFISYCVRTTIVLIIRKSQGKNGDCGDLLHTTCTKQNTGFKQFLKKMNIYVPRNEYFK